MYAIRSYYGRALYSGLFPGLEIDQLDLIGPALRPARIHSKKHFSPILGFGSTGTGINGYDGVLAVVFAVQHQFQRYIVDSLIQVGGMLGYFSKVV